MRQKWMWICAAFLALALVASACGNDDDGAEGDGDTEAAEQQEDTAEPTEEAEATEEPEATEEAEATEEPEATEEAEATEEPEATEEAEDGAEQAAADGCEATVPGTKITYAVFAPNASMDPTVTNGSLVGGTQVANVWDVLMRFNPETGEYEPRVAESITPNDDFTEWTVVIRDDVTFGNGDPLTMDEIFASMQRYLDPREDGVANSAAGGVATIDFEASEVVDDTTGIFRLTRPWATFPLVLADESGQIVSSAVWEQVLADSSDSDEQTAGAAARNTLGTTPDLINAASYGPYEVVEFEPNVRTVLRAREDYWGGPVCIEELEFTFITGSRPRYDAFVAGDVQAAFLREAPVNEEAAASGNPTSFELQNVGGIILVNHGVRDQERVLSDPRLREALNLALDLDVINERAFAGANPMTKLVAHPDSLLYSDAMEECAIDTDPERAAELVQEVKDETGWDGSITLINSDEIPEFPLVIEGLLERAGFDVEVEIGPTRPFVIDKVIIEGDYDIAGWGHNMDAATWVSQLNANYYSTSPGNRAGFGTPEMDAAIDGLFLASTLEEQQAAMADVQCVWAEQYPGAIWGAIEEGIVYVPELQGLERTMTTVYLFSDAYLEEG